LRRHSRTSRVIDALLARDEFRDPAFPNRRLSAETENAGFSGREMVQKTHEGGFMVTNAGGDQGTSDDAVNRSVNGSADRSGDRSVEGAVIVISLWNQGPPDGFLARLTATTPEGMRSVDVAGSPEDLLEKFRIWVTTTRAMHASG
jgi:hypothetical protein